MGITRRQFIQLTGASAAGAVAFSACAPSPSELQVESPARMTEDLVTGIDTWYATICRMCPSGCGIIVRVMEGRAKKIEGNPLYPVNRGKLCARGQAGLQALYHPDRIRGPLRRTGPRGSGQFEPVSWEVALAELGGRLKQAWADGRFERATLISGPLRGHEARFTFTLFRGMLQWLPYDPPGTAAVRPGTDSLLVDESRLLQSPLPHFDIANARFILSFGADFLGTWLSPVQYGVAYGAFRGRPGDRGILVQIEPRMTSTGASADLWLTITPGTEGILALGLARVMISEGLVSQGAARSAGFDFGDPSLAAYTVTAVSQTTGVPESRMVGLARQFAGRRPSLAIAGGSAAAQTNSRFNMKTIYALNRLVEGVGMKGGILPNPTPALPEEQGESFTRSMSYLGALANAMSTGRPQSAGPEGDPLHPPEVLVVRGANPVYDLPPFLQFREALEKAPYITCLSSFMDETTSLADLVLPEHIYLESWGSDVPAPGPGFQVLGAQQPVVNPLFDTRSFGDILLGLVQVMAGAQQPRWQSFRDYLREGIKYLFDLRRGNIQAASFEEFWVRFLQQGGWWDERSAPSAAPPAGQAAPLQPVVAVFAGSEQDYPYHLLPFPSASLGAGGGAHLPWLQAMPDPITTAVWMTWVEVNPETARRQDLGQGDVVRVESPLGSLEAPVYVHPGIHPDVVAIPMGQGHTAFGRYAQDRGANVMSLLDPSLLGSDGDLAWAATRVRLIKTGKTVRISKAEGSVTPVEPSDVDIVGVTRQ